MRGLVAPAHRAYAGYESHPIGGENEYEDAGKEPECLLRQMRAEDAGHERVKSVDEPFHEILRPEGNLLHLSSRDLRKHNETERNHPADDHGIGDREIEWASDLYCLGRQTV